MLYNNDTGNKAYQDMGETEYLGYEIIYQDLSKIGKSNGLGDIETMEPVPPIEIGNRVWMDSNGDGIQDANESGIANVKLTLNEGIRCKETPESDENVTTTDSNGNFVFNYTNFNLKGSLAGLKEDTTYTLCIDTVPISEWKRYSGDTIRGSISHR